MRQSIDYLFTLKNEGFLIIFMSNFDYLSLSGQHLLVFVTLHEVGTVTATAEKLDITQSAISHSLQKMREIFGDELFVRAGRSIAPTLRSRQLYPELKAMLTSLGELTQTQTFVPENADIAYKVLANDYQSNLFFPALYAQIAPQVRSLALEIAPSNRPTVELLRTDDVALAFSPMAPESSDVMATRVFSDISHCFYDPAIREAPNTLDELRAERFVSLTFMKGVSLGGNTNEILQMLDENTCIRVSNFASIPAFVLGTDLLAVMPSRLAYTLGYDRLAHALLPYDASTLTMYMLWHKKYQKDPQHKWFREQVVRVTADLRHTR